MFHKSGKHLRHFVLKYIILFAVKQFVVLTHKLTKMFAVKQFVVLTHKPTQMFAVKHFFRFESKTVPNVSQKRQTSAPFCA